MKFRIVTFDSLRKGGPFIGPKGGLYADAQHKIPYSKKTHGPVKPSNCPRCKGRAHIVTRQRTIGGKESVSSAPCRTCNPKGKHNPGGAINPERRKAKKPAQRQARQTSLDFNRPEQLTLVRALTGSPFKLHGETVFQGIDIAIENRKGSRRTWRDENGTKGFTVMRAPYGYIRGVEGADGDEIDVYIGPHKSSPLVFIVNQRSIKNSGRFDEHKVMLGFLTEKEARECYLAHYTPRALGERLLGSIRTWTMPRFKRWLASAQPRRQPVRKSLVVYR